MRQAVGPISTFRKRGIEILWRGLLANELAGLRCLLHGDTHVVLMLRDPFKDKGFHRTVSVCDGDRQLLLGNSIVIHNPVFSSYSRTI